MEVTIILTLIMCALLFLMIWVATYFYPWERLLEFFPKDIEEKAKQHKPPFPAAPAIGWITMALCMLGFIGVIVVWRGRVVLVRSRRLAVGICAAWRRTNPVWIP